MSQYLLLSLQRATSTCTTPWASVAEGPSRGLDQGADPRLARTAKRRRPSIGLVVVLLVLGFSVAVLHAGLLQHVDVVSIDALMASNTDAALPLSWGAGRHVGVGVNDSSKNVTTSQNSSIILQ